MSCLWRKLTPPKRAEILAYRQFLKRPWHRPPHYEERRFALGHAGCASRFQKTRYRSLCIPNRRAHDKPVKSGLPLPIVTSPDPGSSPSKIRLHLPCRRANLTSCPPSCRSLPPSNRISSNASKRCPRRISGWCMKFSSMRRKTVSGGKFQPRPKTSG